MKYVVGFSGGIDSQACARWVLNRFPNEDVILLNSDAGGNEHPITAEFVHWYSENVHPVVMVSPIVADLGGVGTKGGQAKQRRDDLRDGDPLTFDTLAFVKGRFPSRTAQFCTQFLKMAPSLRWMKANISDSQWCRYTGLRRQESTKRRGTPPEQFDEYFGCMMYAPLLDWTKQMCFDYVKHHGEKVNELYSMGFERVGCAPCVNWGKDDILNLSKRSPEMIDKVRAWEKQTGRTFFPPLVPGMEINWIDDVVRWSKTMHGGKQFGLHVLEERPACESIYGLCE